MPHGFELVPIYLGNMDENEVEQLEALLEDYFREEESLWIICSNLCRWGQQYGFVPTDPTNSAVFLHMEGLDRELLRILEKQALSEYVKYLARTKVNLDGKNSLQLFLRLVEHCDTTTLTRVVRYTQSVPLHSSVGSSIGYGVAICYTQQSN